MLQERKSTSEAPRMGHISVWYALTHSAPVWRTKRHAIQRWAYKPPAGSQQAPSQPCESQGEDERGNGPPVIVHKSGTEMVQERKSRSMTAYAWRLRMDSKFFRFHPVPAEGGMTLRFQRHVAHQIFHKDRVFISLFRHPFFIRPFQDAEQGAARAGFHQVNQVFNPDGPGGKTHGISNQPALVGVP